MSNEIIEFRKEGRVGVIAFTAEGLEKEESSFIKYKFSDICSEISSDQTVRVVVITGMGENIFRIKAPESYEELEDSRIYVPSIVESAAGLEIPVIIGMDGYVAGQGLELALACDIRIATPESTFGLPQVSMGFIPFEGGTQRLPRLIGRAKAMEMILTGEMIDAKTGYEIGLINRIVKKEQLTSTIMTLAQEMSAKSPVSLMYTKEAVNKGMELTLEQGLRLEADLYFLIHTTRDRPEGIKAFQEKRKPNFKGR